MSEEGQVKSIRLEASPGVAISSITDDHGNVYRLVHGTATWTLNQEDSGDSCPCGCQGERS